MIEGTWENEYGSRMTLVADGNRVAGSYRSTTGATGEYRVAGWCGSLDPTPAAGQPVALAVSWRSLLGDGPDGSWHWVSVLCGQLSLKLDQVRLDLHHLLIATSPFGQSFGRRIYLDKLAYWRCSTSDPLTTPEPLLASVGDRLSGHWRADDGSSLHLETASERTSRVGTVSGTMATATSERPVLGFVDLQAEEAGLDHASIALATIAGPEATVTSYGGWLAPDGDTLVVQALATRPTAADTGYMATTISTVVYRRFTDR